MCGGNFSERWALIFHKSQFKRVLVLLIHAPSSLYHLLPPYSESCRFTIVYSWRGYFGVLQLQIKLPILIEELMIISSMTVTPNPKGFEISEAPNHTFITDHCAVLRCSPIMWKYVRTGWRHQGNCSVASRPLQPPILQLHQLCCGHKLDFSLDRWIHPHPSVRTTEGSLLNSWCVNCEAWNRVTPGMSSESSLSLILSLLSLVQTPAIVTLTPDPWDTHLILYSTHSCKERQKILNCPTWDDKRWGHYPIHDLTLLIFREVSLASTNLLISNPTLLLPPR